MLGLTWVRGLVARRDARLAATAAGIAIAVGLLASIGTFLGAAKATMTARAASAVSVDWQVEAQAGADPTAVLRATTTAPGVRAALPVEFAATTGLDATVGSATQTTGPGVVLGLPDGYRSTFPGEIRDLTGASAGVLLAQQTAANLQAAPGDTIGIGRAGLSPITVRVDGIVDLPQADTLFQKVGARAGAQPQAPPHNIVLMPAQQWHQAFDPLAAARPDLVRTQVHAHLTHQLPPDPADAYTRVRGAAASLEVKLTGSGLVGDNLGAMLSAARKDARYAQALFLFVGLPGAILAGLLTIAVAGSGAERRRRDQALLRTRGATTRDLVRLGVFEALLVGSVGALGGLGIAAIVGQIAFGTVDFGATTATAIAWGVGAALIGPVIATLAVALPAWRDAKRLTVAAARQPVGRLGSPRWARFGLDFILLGLSAVVFWLTGRNSYQLVLAPEGAPSISVSYWALAGPALAWVGAGLLAWRIADGVLAHGRGFVARVIRPFSGGLAETAAASMARQRRRLASALALVTLTVAFAASTAVFNSTFEQQTTVDARRSNGADVTVSSPKTVAAQLRSAIGVTVTVTDVQTSRKVIGSSLTAVDLSGLTRVELGFALVLAAAATGLGLALGTAERRRTFAIARALGAKSRQIGSFVWSEATFVTLGGLALGALGGWVLAEMLVNLLTGVFYPPPAALAVPWVSLGSVAAVAVGAVVVASFGAVRSARRPAVSVLREL